MALLQDPLPVAPRLGQEVGDVEIEFRWAPVDEPEHYRIQIATDAGFNDVVFDEVVPGSTVALTVVRRFPDGGRTFFWRVFAGRSENWSPGDHAESFVSGAVDPHNVELPDEEEPLGPAAGLFRTSGLQVRGQADPEELDDQTAVETMEDEVEDAEIVTLGITLVLAGVVVIGVIMVLFFYAC